MMGGLLPFDDLSSNNINKRTIHDFRLYYTVRKEFQDSVFDDIRIWNAIAWWDCPIEVEIRIKEYWTL